MRPLGATALVATALLVAAAVDPDYEKRFIAVRMRTTRQLREILNELEIEVPAGAEKEEIRTLVLEHDAIAKYEQLHPEKVRKPRAPPMDDGGMGGIDLAGQFFGMMDQNRDGKITMSEIRRQEQYVDGKQAPDPRRADEGLQFFKAMDADRDGEVTRAEATAHFRRMSSMMGGQFMHANNVDPKGVLDDEESENVEELHEVLENAQGAAGRAEKWARSARDSLKASQEWSGKQRKPAAAADGVKREL